MMQANKKRMLGYAQKFGVNAANFFNRHMYERGKAIKQRDAKAVLGPRTCAVELDFGLHNGDLLSYMSRNDNAILRQCATFDYVGEPQAYLRGTSVVLEVGWPLDLADSDIKLSDIPHRPGWKEGRFIIGRSDKSVTVTTGVNGTNPHWLIAGCTGSGKTYAMRSIMAQLDKDHTNQIVLIDGKYGDGFSCLRGLSNLVGPLAVDVKQARRALSWSVRTMRQRYASGDHSGRIIIGIDEIQELADDDVCVEYLRIIAAQGRGASVHLLVGTQYPLVSTFGDSTTRRNLTSRLALRVTDYKSSEVAIGSSNPRADKLLGKGDAYAVTPKGASRVQVAYIPKSDLEKLRSNGPRMNEWPSFDAEAIGTLEVDSDDYNMNSQQTAVSLICAKEGVGRPTFRRKLEEVTGESVGTTRARRWLTEGRDIYNALQSEGYEICEV